MSIGFLFDFGEDEMTAVNDEKRGLEILQSYFNYALNEYPENFKFSSVQDVLSNYGRTGPFIAEGLGLNQRINELSIEQATEAMHRLADHGQGRLPLNWQSFHDALKEQALNPSWWETVKFVGAETVKQTGEAFSEVGKGVLSTLQISRYAIPALVFGGIAFWIWKSQKSASGLLGAVSRKVSDK